ncbi:hypothetical protein [Chryseolinea soli]|uniref:Uncharacterized protein n=1 Tax=Chryseolinea soli TaxID=2321403 RepID=A0A385SU31_9BACT|nr:hypothetical protein [Chryseolinea soli]AYB35353.1 hypothetical protein D4L85_00850 [Chryseolinea soli]
MEQNPTRDLRLLKWYAAVSTVAILFLLYQSLQPKSTRLQLEELDVERVNVVEKDGTLKMVISNKQRQHPGLANFKPMPAREREAGMIFFNSSGDECGGLIYDGTRDEAGMVLSLDQFRNDQLMQLQYGQRTQGDSIRRNYGLRLWDRSDDFTLAQQLALVDSLQRLKQEDELNKQFKALREKGLLGVERMFAGKNDKGEVGLFIRDDKGRIRIKIYCDRQNNPRVMVVDEEGVEKGI